MTIWQNGQKWDEMRLNEIKIVVSGGQERQN